MIGDKIGETKGKRLVRRVISTDPPTAEVSFEDSGTMFGVGKFGAAGAVSYRGMLFFQTTSQNLGRLNNTAAPSSTT